MNRSNCPLLALTFMLIASALGCASSKDEPAAKAREITVTSVATKSVTITQPFSGQIRSHHHIEIRAPEAGVLDVIPIKDRQEVKRDEVLFQIKPTISSEDREKKKEYLPVSIKAPFDGIVDRLLHTQDEHVQMGEPLTTLSDIDHMWVYFNVPEAKYLEYKAAGLDQNHDNVVLELQLRNGQKYSHRGQLGAIGAVFNRETGSVAFRADFPNPEHELRHGQLCTVLFSKIENEAVVVPQNSVIELLQKRYVFVVDQNNVARQRPISISSETTEDFVVKSGVKVGEKIVVDGLKHLRDGDKVTYDEQTKKVATNAE